MARTIYEIKDLPFPVVLEQDGRHRFRVIYGQQISGWLSYTDAAKELGQCIMHNCGVAGLLDAKL